MSQERKTIVKRAFRGVCPRRRSYEAGAFSGACPREGASGISDWFGFTVAG